MSIYPYLCRIKFKDMEVEDIEAAKRMKNRGWYGALKEFYEPEDVIRYYDEVENTLYSPGYVIQPPERFFTSDVLKEGWVLLKERDLSRLKGRLTYLKEVEIPKLEKEIRNFSAENNKKQ